VTLSLNGILENEYRTTTKKLKGVTVKKTIPSYPLRNMADFSLRLVVNTHTIKTRTKPPTTPKIMGVLFEDLSLLYY
jgi:hypothetical protein